jgi:hypothetical protein
MTGIRRPGRLGKISMGILLRRMEKPKSDGHIKVCVKVERGIWKDVKKKAVDLDVLTYELVEMALCEFLNRDEEVGRK